MKKSAFLILLAAVLLSSCSQKRPAADYARQALDSLLVKAVSYEKGPLRIWEFMCKNGESDLNVGEATVWVEVKNVSKDTVDLSAYGLTHKIKKPETVKFDAEKLLPGETCVVYDKEHELKGAVVYLMKGDSVMDHMSAENTYFGLSVGRMDGKEGAFYFDEPTPGHENADGYRFLTEKPEILTPTGLKKGKSLKVEIDTHGDTVRYTLDGSIPTMKSPIYEKGITLSKTTVVRAVAMSKGKLPSAVATATYLLNENHKLPVVSVSLDPADMYDTNRGIYVHGPKPESVHPFPEANYWKDWERRAHIEFLDGKEGFSCDCGIKVFGAYSRYRDKKSFHVKFRESYDTPRVRYDIYDRGKTDSVKSFVLRSGSQDDNGTMVRDEYFTTLMGENSPSLLVQAHRPVVLYINGEYFGVYFIREKINKNFVADHLNVSTNNITLIQGVSTADCGSNKEYKELENYARTHDLSKPECYAYMKERVDFQSLMDFKIGEYYSGNYDVGNVRFCKSDDPECDKKWRWIYFDLDWAFYYTNPLAYYVSGSVNKACFNVLISNLLKNPEFKKQFDERLKYHAQHTFEEKHALGVFNKLIAEIEPEMERNCKRWPRMSYKSWQKNVANFRQKIVAKSKLV